MFNLPAITSVLSTASLYLDVVDCPSPTTATVTFDNDNNWAQTSSTFPSSASTIDLLTDFPVSGIGWKSFALPITNLAAKLGNTVTLVVSGSSTQDSYFNFVADDAHNGNAAYLNLTFKPKVQSVSVPSNATYKIGDILNFTVTFDSIVNVIGIPKLPLILNTGGTVQASYVSGSNSHSLVFRYTVTSGNLDADGITVGSVLALNGGSIRSSNNDDAELTLYSVATTTGVKVDGVVPTVSSVSSTSSNGTYKMGDIIPVTVTFSENVRVTGTPTLALNSGGIANYLSGSETSTLTFDYTVGAGESVADLDYSSTTALAGVTIADMVGNTATLTLPTVGGANSLAGNKDILIGILPTITTQAVTAILATTATGNLTVTNLGYPTPTQYGVVWSTSPNPTVDLLTKTTQGTASTTGAFTSSITGLTQGTTYYVKAYATNAAGTIYGDEVTFTTSIPTGLDKTAVESLSLYPNPASEGFYINVGEETTLVQISDLSARLILTQQVIGEGYIDISILPKGVYIVKSNGFVAKLVKK